MAALDPSFGARFARRVLFHAFFFSTCLQHFHPTSVGHSLGLLPVAANLHGAADTAIAEDVMEAKQQRVLAEGVQGTGHLEYGNMKSGLGIDPRPDPRSPQAGTPVPHEPFPGNMVTQPQKVEEEGQMRLETGRRRRLRHQHNLSRRLDRNNSDSNDNNKAHSGEDDGPATAEGGSNPVEISGRESRGEGGAAMVKFRLGGRVESFMAGNVMQDYLNQLVAESVAATENQVRNAYVGCMRVLHKIAYQLRKCREQRNHTHYPSMSGRP